MSDKDALPSSKSIHLYEVYALKKGIHVFAIRKE